MKTWDFFRRSFDHCLEVFRSKYLTKGTFHLKETSKFFFCSQKMKNWVLFGEVFPKVWKFSAQSRETKKDFLWEEKPNCSSAHVFSCFAKTTATFLPNIWQKRDQVPRTIFHTLNALLKTLLKTVLLKLKHSSSSPKKLKSLVKNTKMSSAHKNWKTEYFFGEIFLRVWKTSRSK